MWFGRALEKAKIENYRWHDNRHTFCSRLAMLGENLKVIQQLAGLKTIQMSARYAHMGKRVFAVRWMVSAKPYLDMLPSGMRMD
jgi:site-specific recombinase XerD